ncbi:1-phosphatidylinositol 4,5-bisphosphate phosphodiesterase gamma-1-like, partial [Cyanistes caeruleus]|uniref:1-phosphatidylinositol 4,5-bisphosphate phosphodiesterase gamma-1-like n=1 Tax=Cyanistes caeruleus TaxID=156563 RepID=UPI000CDB439A
SHRGFGKRYSQHKENCKKQEEKRRMTHGVLGRLCMRSHLMALTRAQAAVGTHCSALPRASCEAPMMGVMIQLVKSASSMSCVSCLCSPDKPMQMNQALFMSSGQCGYVLQPTNMRDDVFDPFDKSTLRGTEPLSISIEVLGARHLPKNGRGIVCPFVEVEVSGAEYDNAKQKTEIVADNGLNPLWTPKQFHFQVSNPDFAFLRFVVYEEDMFSDENFLAQATFLVKGLKTGEALGTAGRGHGGSHPFTLLARGMLSFMGGCCWAPGWLSPSCPHDRSHS